MGRKQTKTCVWVSAVGRERNFAKRNRYLSKTRYVVEQSFGTLHRKFRYARAAYFGLIKVSAQSHLKAMCLNLLKAANRLSAPAAA
ncbi:transposase DDE domain protein [Neisseria meningitidis 96060]|nr:transposase DDE domain protein [Neisseria meningitidis 96060]